MPAHASWSSETTGSATFGAILSAAFLQQFLLLGGQNFVDFHLVLFHKILELGSLLVGRCAGLSDRPPLIGKLLNDGLELGHLVSRQVQLIQTLFVSGSTRAHPTTFWPILLKTLL